MNILGIDPGRAKTGLAVVNQNGAILWRAIVVPAELGATLPALIETWRVGALALGNSTSSESARTQIASLELGVAVRVVDESGSTLEARALYWADNPPTGWRRVVPLSLQEPPTPIDDYAAAIVARRALGCSILK